MKKMKNLGKCSLALLMVLMLCVSMLPLTAFAVDCGGKHLFGRPQTDSGKRYVQCSSCSKTCYQVDDDGYHKESVNTVFPTCTEAGYMEYTCNECGYYEKQSSGDPLGHDYGDWKVATPATYDKAGQERRVCSRDGNHIETREIPKLERKFHQLTVVYVDIDTWKTIGVTDAQSVAEGSKIDANQYGKVPEGYTYVEHEGPEGDIMPAGNAKLTVYCKKTTTEDPKPAFFPLKIVYVDIDTKENIGVTDAQSVAEGSKIDADQYGKVPEGYTYVKHEGPKGDIMPAGEATLTVYCRKKDEPKPENPTTHTLTIQYWDDETGKELQGKEEQLVEPGADIRNEVHAEKTPQGYYWVRTEGPETMPEGNAVLNAYYLKYRTVTIHYLEKESGKEVAEKKEVLVKKGDSVSVDSPEVEGYTPDQIKVEFNDLTADAEATVWYTPSLVQTHYEYTVRWLDKDTGEEIRESEVRSIEAGKDIRIDADSEKTVEGYTFCPDESDVFVPANKVAANGNTELKLVFTKNSDPVVEKTVTVTWRNYDGTLLHQRENVKPEEVPGAEQYTALSGNQDPTKAEDASYTYAFSGWSRSEDEEGNVTYTAQYTGTPRPVTPPIFIVTPSTPTPTPTPEPDEDIDDDPDVPLGPGPEEPDPDEDIDEPDVPLGPGPVEPDPDEDIDEPDVPLGPGPVEPDPDEDIDEPDVPLGPGPEEPDPDEDIDEPDVPLGPGPEEPAPKPEEDIPDSDVPMADVPKTGDSSKLWLTLALLSAAGLAIMGAVRKKEGENA